MGEIYKGVTGIKAVEVNYKTAPDLLNEMLSGKVDYGMHDPVFSLAQQREGRLRILAVSTATRLEANPDMPTMTESGVPMDLTGWWARHAAGRHAEADPRPGEQVVHGDGQDRGDEDLSQRLRRRSLHQYARGRSSAVPEAIKDWGDYVRLAKIAPQG